MNSAKHNQSEEDSVSGAAASGAPGADRAESTSDPYADANSNRRFVCHPPKWNLLNQQVRTDFCENRFQISHRVAGRSIPAKKRRGNRPRKTRPTNTPI